MLDEALYKHMHLICDIEKSFLAYHSTQGLLRFCGCHVILAVLYWHGCLFSPPYPYCAICLFYMLSRTCMFSYQVAQTCVKFAKLKQIFTLA